MPWISALDPGKTTDPAALACLEMTEGPDPLCPGRPCWHYAVKALRQWHLGTPYTQIGQQRGVGNDVADVFGQPLLRGSLCAVDQTGVGAAVVDILRGLNPPCVLVGIVKTGGEGWRRDGLTWHVSKAALVSLLVSVLHQGRLTIKPDMPLTGVLTAQLAKFREKQSKRTGNLSWEAEHEPDHDDLVADLMMAVWLGERSPPFRRSDISTGRRAAAQMPRGVFLEGRGLPGRW